MCVFQRACLCLARRKGRAVLLFLIFFMISVLLQICFSVLDGAEEVARDLRSNLGAVFYIRPYAGIRVENGTASDAGTPVVTEEGIEDVISLLDALGVELRGYNTEHYGYVKGEQLHFLPGEGDSPESNMGQVTAVRDSGLTEEFQSGECTLTAGRHITPEDENVVLISTDLAAENGLAVGDTILLTHAGLGQEEGRYFDTIPEKSVCIRARIAGIYQRGAGGDQGQTPTAGRGENRIFADSRLLIALEEQEKGVYEGEISFFIDDPLKLEEIVSKVEALDSIDWDDHILRENDLQYEQIAGELEDLEDLARTLILVGFCLGMGILILVLTLQIRGRVREAGILLSLGRGKREIIGQFILEGEILLIPGFLTGLALTGLLSGVLGWGVLMSPVQYAGMFCAEAGAVLGAVTVSSGAVLRPGPEKILKKMS